MLANEVVEPSSSTLQLKVVSDPIQSSVVQSLPEYFKFHFSRSANAASLVCAPLPRL